MLQKAFASSDITVQLNQFLLASNGSCIVPIDLVKTILDAIDLVDMQKAVYHGAPKDVQQVVGPIGAPPTWKRIEKTCP